MTVIFGNVLSEGSFNILTSPLLLWVYFQHLIPLPIALCVALHRGLVFNFMH